MDESMTSTVNAQGWVAASGAAFAPGFVPEFLRQAVLWQGLNCVSAALYRRPEAQSHRLASLPWLREAPFDPVFSLLHARGRDPRHLGPAVGNSASVHWWDDCTACRSGAGARLPGPSPRGAGRLAPLAWPRGFALGSCRRFVLPPPGLPLPPTY
jgi:hypothetical protein